MNFNAKIAFPGHLTLLKTQSFEKFGDEGFKVLALLNEHKLDMGVSFFKSIMYVTNKQALEPPLKHNHVTKMQSNLSSNAVFETTIVWISQVGRDVYCHGFGQHGG